MAMEKSPFEIGDTSSNGWVGGAFKYCLLLPFYHYLGKISDLTHIFQGGWFNHQLEMVGFPLSC